MLRQEQVIGNYSDKAALAGRNPILTMKERKRMIILIETLQQMKGYKDNTFLLAVSLADRYLAKLTKQQDEMPHCKVILAVTCLLIAAKVE